MIKYMNNSVLIKIILNVIVGKIEESVCYWEWNDMLYETI